MRGGEKLGTSKDNKCEGGFVEFIVDIISIFSMLPIEHNRIGGRINNPIRWNPQIMITLTLK